MNNIDKSTYNIHRQKDPMGFVFKKDNFFVRIIEKEFIDEVEEIFNCGLIDALTKEGLFPDSKITEFEGNFAVKHSNAGNSILPHEMTFQELKLASLCVLRVARTARKFDYNMIDCHPLNIVFKGIKPVYVDLGSFRKRSDKFADFAPHKEFRAAYVRPLQLWRDGNESVAKSLINSGKLIKSIVYYRLKFGFLLKYLPIGMDEKFEKFLYPLFTVRTLSIKKINKYSFLNKCLFIILKILSSIFIKDTISKLEKEIIKINSPKYRTLWKNYQQRIIKKKDRLNKIVSKIENLGIKVEQSLDIGGNQGLISIKLIDRSLTKKAIVQDLDCAALDIGFEGLKKKYYEKISFVNYDFMENFQFQSKESPENRFNSELVCCLALVHHLFITNGYSFESIFNKLNCYTKKYLVVEFMPKGIWTTDTNLEELPKDYNLESFEKALSKRFKIIDVLKTQENFITFFCQKIVS